MAALATALAFSPPASAVSSPRPVILRPTFHKVGTVGNVLSTGRYVFEDLAGATPGGVVVDESARRHWRISYPGCLLKTMGGPWLLVVCKDGYRLYGLGDRRWQRLALSPEASSPELMSPTCLAVGTEANCAYAVQAVGASWVDLADNCPFDMAHCRPRFIYQNIQTGDVRTDPTDATTFTDLNSQTLTRHPCSPLQVPHADVGTEDVDLSGWGALEFRGRLALASGYNGTFLQRCGTHSRQRLAFGHFGIGCGRPTCLPPSSSKVIVWQSGVRELRGVFLPSERRFVLKVPKKVDPRGDQLGSFDDRYTIAISSRTLYVDILGTLWTTSAPEAPTKRSR